MTTTTRPEATIEAHPDLPLVTITREFDAPPELVYRAWTEPDLVAQWMGPRSRRDGHRRVGLPHRRLLTATPPSATARRSPGFYGSFHEVRPGERLVQTFTWEGMPDGVALETMTFEALDGRPLPDRRRLGRRLDGGARRDDGQRHGGRHQRGLREARRAARAGLDS